MAGIGLGAILTTDGSAAGAKTSASVPAGPDTSLKDVLENVQPGSIVEVSGHHKIRTVVLRSSDVDIKFLRDARIELLDPAADGLLVLGDRVRITGGVFTGESTADGSNSPWKSAVIHILGHECQVSGVRIVGVPRVGIGIRGKAAVVQGCEIEGAYPIHLWSGVETGHFGIAWDPPAGLGTTLSVFDCRISTCVQGIFVGNFGTEADGRAVVRDNCFQGCLNHGVYGVSGTGHVVERNHFMDCQVPIVLTGNRHNVSYNSLVSLLLERSGDSRGYTGIDMRDSSFSVIQDNLVLGLSGRGNVGISVDGLHGRTIQGNVVRRNVVVMSGDGLPLIRLGAKADQVLNNSITSNSVISTKRSGGTLVSIGRAGQPVDAGNSFKGNSIVAPRAAMTVKLPRGSEGREANTYTAF
ncbi:right-handed parallel beta-helix repeat-containing protein [Micrococcus terreus]|uniref:right-handed parallel beta-helix repeat-containing protein n=1 Tax=Micrococcus terreus TaxID=574650 RepID=UPI0033E96E90